MADHIDVALLAGFADLPASDQEELRKFVEYLKRRAEKPDEPAFVAYGETHGEVVFDERVSANHPPEEGKSR